MSVAWSIINFVLQIRGAWLVFVTTSLNDCIGSDGSILHWFIRGCSTRSIAGSPIGPLIDAGLVLFTSRFDLKINHL